MKISYRAVKVCALQDYQSVSGEELSALLPSMLDKASRRVVKLKDIMDEH
jgi:hypothetical protein